MDISHLKQKFIDEAENLLTSFDNTLVELEKDKENKQLIGEAFRVMHTIKGTSGMYGFDKIVEITHELESLYDMIREGMMPVSADLIEISFAASDLTKALLMDEFCAKGENIQLYSALVDNIGALKTIFNSTSPKPIQPKNMPEELEKNNVVTWHIMFQPNDDIINRAINLVYTFHDLFILGDYKIKLNTFQGEAEQFWSIFLVTDKGFDAIEEALIFIMDYCKICQIANFNMFDKQEFEKNSPEKNSDNCKPFTLIQLEEPLQETDCLPIELLKPKSQEAIAPALLKYKTNHINVNAEKLDTLMYLVSELVTTKSELLNSLHNNNITKALDAGEKIEKLSKLFSENALNLRLVSIHEMIEKFKRLIRDLAKQLGKQITFSVIGSDTELDKSIIDHISEPVMHLIRNCIDHGIELPEVRKSKGKSEVGTIRFETVKTGNYVYIHISDDGNGIDTNYVHKKAVEKGFVSPDTALSENEIYNLIFLPGFSTAESLTNVSGRGVGMDIVLKKIQEIRGEISIVSQKSVGTSFHIKLQQTISIIDTLLIKASDITYAIPLETIETCILEAHNDLMDKHNQLLNFNGELIPYLFIEEPKNHQNTSNGNTDKLVVIKKHDKTFALVVDQIIGEYQAVIKPIGKTFHDVRFLSGASLLGDGSIALLIDTEKLWYLISEN